MPRPAARYAKLLKHVRDASELARSGALVLNDGEAAIYFLWGQPSHAYLRSEDGTLIEGEAALKAIALRLTQPRRVSWRASEVLQKETLRCTAEELTQTFVHLEDAAEEVPDGPGVSADGPAHQGGDRDGEPVHYNLADFPLLPDGPPLWSEVPANAVHLEVLLPSLPTVLLQHRGERSRGAGVVRDGTLVDGVFVDAGGMRVGSAAVEALRTVREGTLSAFEMTVPMAEALPVLWRSRVNQKDIDSRWIDGEGLLDALQRDGDDRAVIIGTASALGVVLFHTGHVAGAWTSLSLQPTTLLGEIHALLRSGEEGYLTVLEHVDDVPELSAVTPEDLDLDAASLAASLAAWGPAGAAAEAAASPQGSDGSSAAADVMDTAAVDDEPAARVRPAWLRIEPDPEPGAPDDADTQAVVEPRSDPGAPVDPGVRPGAHGTGGDDSRDDAEAAPEEGSVAPAEGTVTPAEFDPWNPPSRQEPSSASLAFEMFRAEPSGGRPVAQPERPIVPAAGSGARAGTTAGAEAGPGAAADASAPATADADAETNEATAATAGQAEEPWSPWNPQWRVRNDEERAADTVEPPAADASAASPPAAPADMGTLFAPRGAESGAPAPLFSFFGGGAGVAVGSGTARRDQAGDGEPDYNRLVEDLVGIAHEFLGEDARLIEGVLRGADRSAPGLRRTILSLRHTALPGHDEPRLQSMARTMQLHIADRLSAA